MSEDDASIEAEYSSVNLDTIFCVVKMGATYQVIPDWLVGGDNCEVTRLFFAGEEILY